MIKALGFGNTHSLSSPRHLFGIFNLSGRLRRFHCGHSVVFDWHWHTSDSRFRMLSLQLLSSKTQVLGRYLDLSSAGCFKNIGSKLNQDIRNELDL